MAQMKTTIVDWVHHFRKEGEVVLLESQKKDHPESKISYLAARPKRIIKSYGANIHIQDKHKEEVQINDNDPWTALKAFRNQQSWLFGYYGYDLKNYLEDLKSENSEFYSAPDMFFMEPEVLIQFEDGKLPVFILGDEMQEAPEEPVFSPFYLKEKNKISKQDYCQRIEQAKSEIAEGEYYEINLSHAIAYDFKGDPLALYTEMNKVGEVPFAAFCSFKDLSVCCQSPERFIRKKGNRIWSQPIKGTISADGDDASESERKLNTEKNRAENLMIVDLVRNDLNRIAKPGSVEVSKLFEIQHFSTVHQMVSTIECEIRDEIDEIEVIKSCFPMGSMTGAPKISAMRAIEKLEDHKRGIYSGAIGYFDPKGDFDFNVVIRTAVIQGNTLTYAVGGAITSDSDPEEEWEETLWKSQALRKTVNNSG
tara:strand:- start:306723 stop:307991 length:1269 start_codon:yes stop_codon:yes gene_type:complete